jgi:iron complex outermembrane recepter protein
MAAVVNRRIKPVQGCFMTCLPPPASRLAGNAIRLAVAATFSSSAWSQASDTVVADAPVRQLGTVVITGGRPTSLPSQIPTTIEGITGREVETKINATDSEDALKYLPSLLVRKRYIGDYNHAVLSTRASGTGNSARSLVYADGILLSNLLGNGATFTPRWGLVTPEEIERVDVLYGPFSAAYPGNSVGAVVDYVTRMPAQFEAHVKVGAFTQPFELYNTKATYDGRQASASLGDRAGALSWWINVRRLDSEGQPLVFATRLASAGVPAPAVTGAVPGRNRLDQDWFILGTSTQYDTVQDHAKAKLGFDFSPTLKASYTLGVWHNGSHGASESYLRDGAGNTVYGGNASDFPLTRETLTHLMHALSLKSTTRGIFDWEIAASAYDYREDLLRTSTTPRPGADSGGAGRLTDMKGTGWATLALKGIWRPGGADGVHVADFGLQHDRYALRNRVTTLGTDWTAEDTGPLSSRAEGTTTLTSAWGQHAWRVSDAWKAFFGGRLERWNATDGLTQSLRPPTATSADCDESVLAGYCTRQHPERRETSFSPKAAVAFQAGDAWVVKLSTGRAVRYPTVSELYQGSFGPTGVFQNGDPALKPERSWTTEFSNEWEWAAQRLRATLFHENTRDALYSQTNTTVTPNVSNVQNVDEIRTYGLELAHQARDLGIQGLELTGSLTYADSKVVRNDKFPASVGKWQIRVPKWRASALASWKATQALTAGLGARYGGRQYSTLDNSDPNGFAYQGASKFFTTDLRVHYRIDRQWSAALGVDNLNNYKYWNFHPYPQRTFSAEVKFDH